MEWLVSLLLGAGGGNLAGYLLKGKSLGTLWNSVVGILGGGLGGTVLGMLGLGTDGGMDLSGIIGSVAGGGVGGGILMAIIGVIKSAMNKS